MCAIGQGSKYSKPNLFVGPPEIHCGEQATCVDVEYKKRGRPRRAFERRNLEELGITLQKPSATEAQKSKLAFVLQPCVVLIIFTFLAFAGSLSFAVWWSVSRNDVSGGFTIGSYIVAVIALPIGIASYQHSRSGCQCWQSTGANDEGVELMVWTIPSPDTPSQPSP